MYRYLYYLIQPGVVSTGLMGTALQIGLAFTLPLIVFGAIALFIFFYLSGPSR
jgi:hypothetical protein